MNLTTLDIILLAPLVFGIIRGFIKGFIRELAAILGIFLGVLASYILADKVFKYFTIYFENVEFELRIISYVIVFFGVILLINSLASLLTRTLKLIALNGINRILGALFGGFKWLILLIIVCFSLNKIQKNRTLFQKSTLRESQVYHRFLGYGEKIAEAVGFEELTDKQQIFKDDD